MRVSPVMMSIAMHHNNSYVVSMAHWLAVLGPSIAPHVACGMWPWVPKGVIGHMRAFNAFQFYGCPLKIVLFIPNLVCLLPVLDAHCQYQ